MGFIIKLTTSEVLNYNDLIPIYHYGTVFKNLDLMNIWEEISSLSIKALKRVDIHKFDFLMDLFNEMNRLQKEYSQYYEEFSLAEFRNTVLEKFKEFFKNKLDQDRKWIYNYIDEISKNKEVTPLNPGSVLDRMFSKSERIKHSFKIDEVNQLLHNVMKDYFLANPGKISKEEFLDSMGYLFDTMPNSIIEDKSNELEVVDVYKIISQFKDWPENLIKLNPDIFLRPIEVEEKDEEPIPFYTAIAVTLKKQPSDQTLEMIFNDIKFTSFPHIDILNNLLSQSKQFVYDLVANTTNIEIIHKIEEENFSSYYIQLGLIQNIHTIEQNYEQVFEEMMTDQWNNLDLLLLLDENNRFKQQMDGQTKRELKARIDDLQHKKHLSNVQKTDQTGHPSRFYPATSVA